MLKRSVFISENLWGSIAQEVQTKVIEHHTKLGYTTLIWHDTQTQYLYLPHIEAWETYFEDEQISLYNSIFFFDQQDYLSDFLSYFYHSDLRHNIIFCGDDNKLDHLKIRTIPTHELPQALTSPLYIFEKTVLHPKFDFLESTCFILNSEFEINTFLPQLTEKKYIVIADFKQFISDAIQIQLTEYTNLETLLSPYFSLWNIAPLQPCLVCISNGLRKYEVNIINLDTTNISPNIISQIPIAYKKIRQLRLSAEEEKMIKKIWADPSKRDHLIKLLNLPKSVLKELYPWLRYPPKSEINFNKQEIIFIDYDQRKVKLSPKELALYKLFYEKKIKDSIVKIKNKSDDLTKYFQEYLDKDDKLTDKSDKIAENLFNNEDNFVQTISKIKRKISDCIFFLSEYYIIKKDEKDRYHIPAAFD